MRKSKERLGAATGLGYTPGPLKIRITMTSPLHSSSSPPPKFNRWVIAAAAASIIAIIVLFSFQPDPDAVAPDGPLGQTAE